MENIFPFGTIKYVLSNNIINEMENLVIFKIS